MRLNNNNPLIEFGGSLHAGKTLGRVQAIIQSVDCLRAT